MITHDYGTSCIFSSASFMDATVWNALNHKQHFSNVHIYSCYYEPIAPRIDELQRYLSEAEQDRANCYATLQLKNQFILSRGLLRYLLALYTQVLPERVEFIYNVYGKPSLKNYPIHFNMAHSHQMLIYGISMGAPVGVDIEHLDDSLLLEEVKSFVFTKQEMTLFETLKNEDKGLFFYQLWTQKEALIKAQGLGLSSSFLQTIETVAHKMKHTSFLLNDRTTNAPTSIWKCNHLPCPQGYVGAVAFKQLTSEIAYITMEGKQPIFDTIQYLTVS